MIQDIMPRIFHNDYSPKEPEKDDIVFVFRHGKILAQLQENGKVVFPTAEAFSEKLQYLFRIDDRSFFLYTGESRGEGDSFCLHSLRTLRRARPKEVCFAAMTAWHLYVWYRDNRFCGRCGGATVHDEQERMLSCPACGNRIYPRINPAVIVGVTDGDRIMMTRYAGREHKGNALIAGFCEIGETVEETVRREVMEEVGLHVKNIRYYKSQPWGFAGDLLMGFFCEVDGRPLVHMDTNELESARWVARGEIGDEPAHVSLTADMIMHFKNEPGRIRGSLTPETAKETEKARTDQLPDIIRGIWYGHRPGIPERKGTAAVVIPLIRKDDGYHILYEQRAAGLAHQPGEICFPGGIVEVGESPREAAVRETTEELLVDPDQIEILAALDAQMGPSGAPVWPFAALLHDYHDTYSESEVGKVFSVPLSWFKSHEPLKRMAELVTRPGEDFPYELIPGGENYPFRKKKQEIVFYRTPEAVIWGVTAKITEDFICKIRKEVQNGIT
ncbi:MAG: NAD(+) diphosphatase [Eubacterium sp.]|nr:NAD(+) diphosphatase [Eubacterium sp.]